MPMGPGGKGLRHLGPRAWSPLCQERAERPSESGAGVVRLLLSQASAVTPVTGRAWPETHCFLNSARLSTTRRFLQTHGLFLMEYICFKKEAQGSTWKAVKNICWRDPGRVTPCVYTLRMCTEMILSIVYSGKTRLPHRGQDSGFLWGGRRRCWPGRGARGTSGVLVTFSWPWHRL